MSNLIPQHFIDGLLVKLDIVEIISQRIQLKKSGKNYTACCPFHNEKTPSFSVSHEKQFYYCFGCGVSGNLIGFIMAFDRVDFVECIQMLANQLGQDIPQEHANGQQQQNNYSILYDLLEKSAKYFQYQLKIIDNASLPIRYLKGRGIDGRNCKRFGVGYAKKGWHYLKNHLNLNLEQEKKLLQTGMLVEKETLGQSYDRFRNRVMFPIRNVKGKVIAFGGRVLDNSKPKYLNSPESPVFHKSRELYGLYEVKKNNKEIPYILIVEGYMDVIALAQHGICLAVATLGTSTTLEHIQRLFKITSEIFFCFDGDLAGKKAAWRALEVTMPEITDGKQARFLFLPEGEDPDSLVRKEGAQSFFKRFKSALSIDTYFFNHITQGINLHTMDGQASLAHKIKPYLKNLKQGVFRHLILNKLAGIIGLSSQQLNNSLVDNAPEEIINLNESEKKKPLSPYYAYESNYFFDYGRETKMSPSIYAIRHLLVNPKLASEVIDCIDDLKKDSDPDTLILIDLLNSLKLHPNMHSSALIAQWTGTEKGKRICELASLDLGIEGNNEEYFEAITRIKQRIKQKQHQDQYRQLKVMLTNKRYQQLDHEQRDQLKKLIEDKKNYLKH